jgi:hypothetical protein
MFTGQGQCVIIKITQLQSSFQNSKRSKKDLNNNYFKMTLVREFHVTSPLKKTGDTKQ